MAVETPDQKSLLTKIAAVVQVLNSKQEEVSVVRTALQKMMVEAKDLKVSSYKIAEAAKLSQPRVMQIIKEARALAPADVEISTDQPPVVHTMDGKPPYYGGG